MFLLLVVFLFTLLIFYNFVWKRWNLPPGPIPVPLIGNVLTLERLSPGYEAFQQWTKQYGPVFTFWLAEEPIVAVTDFSLIKETFIKDADAYVGRDFFGKAFDVAKSSSGNYGMVLTQGEIWSQMRRFSLKVFRNLGMGRNVMEEKIMLEVNTLLETIETDLSSTNGEAMKTTGYSLSPLINVAVGSVINQLVFGFRFIKESHNHFYAMNKVIDAHNRGLGHSITSVVLTLPWLRHFPLFSYYFDQFDIRLGQLYQYFDEQIRSTIERRKKEAQSNFVRDEEDTYFVDAFVKEIEQRKTLDQGQEDQYFNIKSLRGLCVDLFIAGQETSSNTLNFLVLYMMVFPEVQTKLQEELDRVIGDNEDGSKRICLADKSKLPYTNAVINETQRFCNLLPINLIHRTTKDVDCGGYRIAKGTKIVPMISSVLYDEKIFTEPQKFMPERFIENGQLKKCEELIPFSIGKRQCMGESLARAELFLFTANLFYMHKVKTVDVLCPPSLEKRPGLTVCPTKYQCIIEKRKQICY